MQIVRVDFGEHAKDWAKLTAKAEDAKVMSIRLVFNRTKRTLVIWNPAWTEKGEK